MTEERKAAAEMAVRMHREMNIALYGNPYPTAMDRVTRDIQEQERQPITLNPGAVELDWIRRPTDPLVDNRGSAARAVREHMDVFEQQCRCLDPLSRHARLTKQPASDKPAPM